LNAKPFFIFNLLFQHDRIASLPFSKSQSLNLEKPDFYSEKTRQAKKTKIKPNFKKAVP
jgi:hypothetical protein